MSLRDYQREANENVHRYIAEGERRLLVSLPTGTGKTRLFCGFVKDFDLKQGEIALAVAHSDDLITQAADSFRESVPGAWVDVEKGAKRASPFTRIVVGSVQTLKGKRLAEFLARFKGKIRTLIVDEAHRAASKTYRELIDAVLADRDDCVLLGVTATPKRTDNVGLGTVFNRVAYSMTIEQAVERGYLCPLKAYQVETSVSLDDVSVTSSGDLNPDQLAKAVDQEIRNRKIVDGYLDIAFGKKAIVFAASVSHAQRIVELFNAAGVPAEASWGELPVDQRREIVARFRRGDTRVLANFGLYLEGFDVADTEVVIHGRPTKSGVVYCLDTDTEILTPAGFRRHDEIEAGDIVAAYDLETGQIAWTAATAKVERDVYPDELMAELRTPTLDIRVTDTHNLVVRRRGNRERLINAELMTVRELAQRNSSVMLPCAGEQDAPGLPLTDDELLFIGLFISDGNLNRRNAQLTIAQARHQSLVNDRIRQCLWNLGVSHSIRIENRRSNFNATSPLVKYVVHRGRVLAPEGGRLVRDPDGISRLDPYLDKNLAPALESLTREQLAVLLEGIHFGDGAKQEGNEWTRRSYHLHVGTNKTLAERLQSLCVRRGYRCNLAIQKPNIGTGDRYVLHVKDGSYRAFKPYKKDQDSGLTLTAAKPGERVWCVETAFGTIVTRRNGKVAVLGNCQATGRITRPHPSVAPQLGAAASNAARRALIASSPKPFGIVIDVVDVTRRHTLQSLPSLFGLPPRLNAQGRSITEAAKAYKELSARDPGLALAQVDISAIETKLREVDVFSVPTMPREIGTVAHLAWFETERGRRYGITLPPLSFARREDGERIEDFDWVLRCEIERIRREIPDANPKPLALERLRVVPGSRTTVNVAFEVVENALGEFELLRSRNGEQRKLGSHSTLAAAIGACEKLIREYYPHAVRALSVDASWQTEPISPKQTRLLRKLGTPEPRIPKTRGEASRLIDHIRNHQEQEAKSA